MTHARRLATPAQPDDVLRAELDGFLATYDFAGRRGHDPVAFPHRFADPLDRELVAFFAACLAYGRADLIARGLEDVLARMGPGPAAAAARDDAGAARRRFEGFVYRVTRGDDLARLWLGLAHLQRAHGSIGRAFAALDDPAAIDLRGTLERVRAAICAPTADWPARRAFRHLLPDPAKGSACKRLNMLLRWMVRGPDGIDFGDWAALGAHRLTIPVDTHVHRIARYLGLTDRAAADWRTAAQITAALRRLDADDPLRYDFALCHLGISGRCPARRVPAICAECPIQRICCLA
ncbi:MAG: TIGR02757 family protein [Myxococcales bacterium]|nr:TIGR02757 family protein [Myxococcales bacterium]